MSLALLAASTDARPLVAALRATGYTIAHAGTRAQPLAPMGCTVFLLLLVLLSHCLGSKGWILVASFTTGDGDQQRERSHNQSISIMHGCTSIELDRQNQKTGSPARLDTRG
jgi:hypothetical protein